MHSKKSLFVLGLALVIGSLCLVAGPAMTAESEIQYKTDMYYTVKQGDTLWDLSDRFFDSPWVWPGLWGKNPHIPNPHHIYPGQKIRIYNRSAVESTYQQVMKEKPAAISAAPISVSAAPAELKRHLKTEPSGQKTFHYSQMDEVGFIRKEPLDATGFVYKTREDYAMVSRGDIIYVKSQPEKTLLVGTRYTTYRIVEAVSFGEKPIGDQYLISGSVEILENKSGFSIARVVDSFQAIDEGDLLIPYLNRKKDIPIVESPRDVIGQIVKGAENETMFGETQIVFVDKGQNDGLEPGQIFEVYYENLIDVLRKEKWEKTPVVIGSFIVLHAEPTTASVLIIDSSRTLEPGHLFQASAR